MKPADRLIVALDVENLDEARRIVKTLSAVGVRHFKVGLGLFTAAGPAAVDLVHQEGAQVFLDLKFHDIPNTVAHACRSAARLGVWMTNLHISGGGGMVRQAISAVAAEAAASRKQPPILIGVTVLTSMGQAEIAESGIQRPVQDQVLQLAKLAQASGLNGVVASPKEAQMIRSTCGPNFVIVTPGIRPAAKALWQSRPADDQQRIATPAEAVKMGADYIVVGRPIVEAEDPAHAAKEVLVELGEKNG